jgi:hypothetical protein
MPPRPQLQRLQLPSLRRRARTSQLGVSSDGVQRDVAYTVMDPVTRMSREEEPTRIW